MECGLLGKEREHSRPDCLVGPRTWFQIASP
jgi:hypothetical protein